jgi:integrase/recombinase XerC
MRYQEDFLKYLTFEKRYSFHTQQSYQIDLNQFAEFCKQTFEVDDPSSIDHKMIRKWIVQLMDENISSRSVNRKLSALKSFYRFLMKEGILQSNPLNKIIAPKIKKRLPSFVEEKQMDVLLDDIEFDDNFDGTRNKIIIEMFYYTGIRLSELVNLKNTDVDASNLLIKVTGKRNKQRLIPFTKEFAGEIEAYKQLRDTTCEANTEGYLFVTNKGAKLYPELVYRVIRKYLQLVTTIDKKSPHVIRHTFATHMLNKGADLNAIKELLGHSSLSATQVYTHNSFEKLTRIYKQAHPRA